DQYYFGAFTDRTDGRWFANWGTGVVHITTVADSFHFEVLLPATGQLSSSFVMGISQDSRGRMWFGHDNNPATGDTYGLDIYDPAGPTAWQHYDMSNTAMAGNRVWAIGFDPLGRAWLGYRPGGAQV